MKTYVHFLSYLAQFFLMRYISDKIGREKQNTHFTFSNLFRQSCRLWDNVEKYWRAGQATDDNMAHGHFMPDT